jgi:hypothetical protein
MIIGRMSANSPVASQLGSSGPTRMVSAAEVSPVDSGTAAALEWALDRQSERSDTMPIHCGKRAHGPDASVRTRLPGPSCLLVGLIRRNVRRSR